MLGDRFVTIIYNYIFICVKTLSLKKKKMVKICISFSLFYHIKFGHQQFLIFKKGINTCNGF